MLEFINVVLGILTFLALCATVLIFWFEIVEAYSDDITWKSWLKVISIFAISIGLCYGTFVTSIKLNIINAQATIEAFELVKEQKNQLGDSYIIEPTMLTKYNDAVATLNKYEKLGLYKK